MEQRNLGKSGLLVSVVGLGCNNFGGRIDLDATQQGRPQGARPRDHVLRRGRHLWRPARQLRGVPRRDPRRPPQGHRAGDQVRAADGRRGPVSGRLAALHHGRGRGEPQAAQDRLDRPLPAAPARSADADRGDLAGARRPRAPGQGPLHRLLDLAGLAGRRGAVDGEASRPPPFHLVPGGIQPARARPRPRDDAGAGSLWSRADPVSRRWPMGC